MKGTNYRFTAALTIAAIMSAGALAAIPVSPADSKKIDAVAKGYVHAFEQGDLTALKKVVTPTYIKANGGEKHWSGLLKDLKPDYKAAKIKNLRTHAKSKTEVFVQFDIVNDSGSIESMKEKWFLLKKRKGDWKIDVLTTDFDPDDGP